VSAGRPGATARDVLRPRCAKVPGAAAAAGLRVAQRRLAFTPALRALARLVGRRAVLTRRATCTAAQEICAAHALVSQAAPGRARRGAARLLTANVRGAARRFRQGAVVAELTADAARLVGQPVMAVHVIANFAAAPGTTGLGSTVSVWHQARDALLA